MKGLADQVQIMADGPVKEENKISDEKEGRIRKIRMLGLAYRILLVLGLILFAATAILVIFTTRITACTWTIPAVIFLLGIILARLEYRLFLLS